MSTREHKRKCAFPNCKIRAKSGMFKFPKDEERRKKWLENCQLTANQILDSTTICQFHFRPQDLQIPANFQNKLLLKPGVVPIPYDPLEVNETNSEDLALVDVNEIVTNTNESKPENKDGSKMKHDILKDLTKEYVKKPADTEPKMRPRRGKPTVRQCLFCAHLKITKILDVFVFTKVTPKKIPTKMMLNLMRRK